MYPISAFLRANAHLPGMIAQQRLCSNLFFGSGGVKQWAYDKSRFNQYGLMRDDLLMETDVVKEALRRLPQDLKDERTFRIVRALHLCMRKVVLPKEQWMKLEEDVLYLTPYVEGVEKEIAEREEWDKE